MIIDDDEYSADNLCLELKRYGQLVVEGIARNGSNGKKMIDKLRPDILFLDVELPDMKGIELLEQINSCVTWNMQVIFYTAYDKYMINAIRESAFDYLLKPIDRKELECIITRFLKKMDEPATPRLLNMCNRIHRQVNGIVISKTMYQIQKKPAEISAGWN